LLVRHRFALFLEKLPQFFVQVREALRLLCLTFQVVVDLADLRF